MRRIVFFNTIVLVVFLAGLFPGADSAFASPFDEAWRKLTKPLVSDVPVFTFVVQAGGTPRDTPAINEPRVPEHDSASATPTVDTRSAELLLSRTGSDSWYLRLQSPWAGVEIRRSATETLLVVAEHLIVFSGRDEADCTSLLNPSGALGRIFTRETSLQGLPFLLSLGTLDSLNRLPGCENLFTPVGSATWVVGGEATLTAHVGSDTARIDIETSVTRGKLETLRHLSFQCVEQATLPGPLPAGLHDQAVSRAELETMILHAVRRFCSIRFPSADLLQPTSTASTTGGLVRPFGEHTLLFLYGSPRQIGVAHGKLLGPAIRRMVDSTFYLVGLVTTVQNGKWFPAVLDEAFARIKPHVPAAYLEELNGIASGCPEVTPREIVMANIFPEYFHCSGFAVFGRATASGTLYHGRVLDYMTEIGLQQAAVTMIIAPAQGNPFMNVGYAGFVGSVTGINNRGLSVGEMGGGGRGRWDGMPMTFMMRKALEDCSTVDQVVQFWQDTPRTCEYYYVFAQGTPSAAVGVKATPDGVEIIRPGEAHPQIGAGIEDTIVMSAGSRLKELRKRLETGHGTFTSESALHLMDRPVSMRSNLHNALFAPAELKAWVAHAGLRQPAAERPYVMYELGPLFEEAISLSHTSP